MSAGNRVREPTIIAEPHFDVRLFMPAYLVYQNQHRKVLVSKTQIRKHQKKKV